MQYPDDEMDELFRKAAKDYPLKLQDDNWESVASRLQDTGAVNPEIADKNKNNKNGYRQLLLILLFFMTSGAFFFLLMTTVNKKPKHSDGNKPKETTTKMGVNQSPPIIKNNREVKNRKTLSVNGYVAKSIFSEKFLQQKAKNEAGPGIEAADENLAIKTTNPDNPTGKENTVEVNGINSDAISNEIIQRNESTVINGDDTTAIQTAIMPVSNEQRPSVAAKDKKIYLGVFTGPQFNEVKNQGLGPAGIYSGLLAGLKVNNRLAIETGFFISEKRYFSNGEYFSMKNVASAMPSGMKLESVRGRSTILEIPLKAKFDVVEKKSYGLFAAAGLSSYILTKESNNYLALINGNHENLNGSYSGTNKYFTSALQISTGYEYKTRKKARIRIEPYVQIPLKGIGVGALPVLSTGVNLGITFPVLR